MSLSRSVIKAHAVRWTQMPAGGWEARPPSPAQAPAASALDLDSVQQSLLATAVGQSQLILEKARAQAAELIRTAQAQAAEVTEQAQQEGREAAEAETAHLLLSAKGVLDEVCVWRESVAARSEGMILALVTDIAQTLFGEGWTLDRGALHAAFARAVAEARPLGDLRIHVHPDDAVVLGASWPEQQAAQSGQRLELVPDAAIRRGGCTVEGDYGLVDARVETQLHLAGEALEQVTQTPTRTPEDL
jgi:flagellar assembly protein FliH